MTRRFLAAAALLAVSAGAAWGQRWHEPLSLGGGGVWTRRVQVTVRNALPRKAAGDPVKIRVGRQAGQVNLAGALAQSVRVCDAGGQEMLYDLTGPGGDRLTRGEIPPGGWLTVPVECDAGGQAAYFVYFGNRRAWEPPDFLDARPGVFNGGMELGQGQAPAGWRHESVDADHKASWVAEGPHGGARCVKTVVAGGGQPTWVATRQYGIHILGGAKYVMTAWVRAEGVRGSCGWYVHVGTSANSQMLNHTLSAGAGTFGWKRIRVEFTAPAGADTASLGTVLHGTGTAWFDDVTLQTPDQSGLTARAGKVERLEAGPDPAAAKWAIPAEGWDHRTPVRVAGLGGGHSGEGLVYVGLGELTRRWRARAAGRALRVTAGAKQVEHFLLPDGLLFAAGAAPRTIETYHVYFGPPAAGTDPAGAYAALLAGKRNLVAEGSFEDSRAAARAWPGSAEGARPAGTEMGIVEGGLFGKRCVRLHVPHTSRTAWTGWRQDVHVKPGRTYFLGAWLKTKDIRGGSVQVHAHYRNAEGGLCKTRQYTSIQNPLQGDNEWTFLGGHFEMPPDIATFQIHLTMLATGTVWHDGVALVEVRRATVGALQRRTRPDDPPLAAWPVHAIVKVFPEDLPPAKPAPAAISSARNEYEPVQLAVRSNQARKGVRIEVEPPAGPKGRRLDKFEIGVVGYVPIDYPTNYYTSHTPRWYRKVPTSPPGSDGWPGLWPDPLLPKSTFDLPPGQTRPIWVTFSIPKSAPAGEYKGAVRLMHQGKAVARVPLAVRVWDFILPDTSRTKAIHDVRFGPRGSGDWIRPGQTLEQFHHEMWRFMAKRRTCPDTIQPAPKIAWRRGKVVADFTAFDKAAAIYFDELKLPHAYTPWSFYLFGWGHPPAVKFGQQAYEGEWPFEGVDRSKLRPEFRKAFQACLKAYWDHVKAKGWADKILFYISDEPFYTKAPIRAQMQALCRMIHEVDPKIPIYSSTWHHVPDWDGSLDVWGISHFGQVPVAKIRELEQAGKRILWTTDGQMCTDTPYCAVERLLPHYCFQYGAEGYEFWGVNWQTYDPYRFGWHAYIHQSTSPGESTWVRYPNGDGYLVYPGKPVGHDGIVSSIRLEQAREGVEDAEYLFLLRDLVARAKAAGRDASAGEKALKQAAALVSIPNAGGRWSSKILPDPGAVFRVKRAVAEAIERLK